MVYKFAPEPKNVHTEDIMRTYVNHFLVLAVLVMGIESSADMANGGHLLDSEGSHHNEVMHESSSNPGVDSEPDRENCEHCCHGHSFSVTVRSIAASVTFSRLAMINLDGQVFIAQPQAPPTPPPKTSV